jgi:hypothetical protein
MEVVIVDISSRILIMVNPYHHQIEEWCYKELEENFGGWEINEGSQGEFQFDFNEKTVTLSHTYNTLVDESNTIWEEEF